MDRKYGTDHPDKIDAISVRDGVVYLHKIQVDDLDDERILALQEKLNNYLAFILGGQLEESYPNMAEPRKVIRLELQNAPIAVVVDFLNTVESVLEAKGIGFEYSVANS